MTTLLQRLRNLTRPLFAPLFSIALDANEVHEILHCIDTAVKHNLLKEVPEIHLKTARRAMLSRWPMEVSKSYEFTERELWAIRAGLTAYQAHCADCLKNLHPALHSIVLINADQARKLARKLRESPTLIKS